MQSTRMRSIREQIDAHAHDRADEIFLFSPERATQLTFCQLQSSTQKIGTRLDQLGIKSHAKVAFLLDNGIAVVELFLSIMASNRVVVPLNAVAGPTQLQYVLEHSDAEVVFVAPCYRNKLDDLLKRIKRDILVIVTSESRGPHWPKSIALNASPTRTRDLNTTTPSPSDPALLLYTSGSTGLPKGALLTHRAVISGATNVVAGHNLSAPDRVLCVLPVYHINGAMVTVCAPLVSGSSVVIPQRFSAQAFWQLVADYQCTWSSVVPTIIKYLLNRAAQEPFVFGSDQRLKNFRFARSASASLPNIMLQQWEQIFHVPMIETLGLTETAGTVATNPMPPAVRKPGSVGMAYGMQIKIIDQQGTPCAANTPGEILIRGNSLLQQYYKNHEATRAAFVGDWFRSGDLGLLDADNYLFITGRLKELILRGGENIAPREIDDALYRHKAVLEAAAVGVHHQDYGQEVVACVVLREGMHCTEQELKEFCIDFVGKIKAPKTIYFLNELPKGPSGKILRLELPKMIDAIRG